MSYGESITGAVEPARDGTPGSNERLSLGVAARLSRYLGLDAYASGERP